MKQEYRRVVLDFSSPVIMGVVNVTPDSFSDGGDFLRCDAALLQARRLAAQGAQIIDVGGESTRPGAEAVSAEEELRRVGPLIEALEVLALPLVISIDTRRAQVAGEALRLGAEIVNDVSALGDADMAATVARFRAGLVLMHMRGEPDTMQAQVKYDDVVEQVTSFLRRRLARAEAAGVAQSRCMVDPGIGFGKHLHHNLSLTRALGSFSRLGVPVVYGPSRKSFLGQLTGKPAAERDEATAAACALAVFLGADVLRVHAPARVADAVAVATALRNIDGGGRRP